MWWCTVPITQQGVPVIADVVTAESDAIDCAGAPGDDLRLHRRSFILGGKMGSVFCLMPRTVGRRRIDLGFVEAVQLLGSW